MLLCSNAVASPHEPVCELTKASNVDFKVKNANTHTNSPSPQRCEETLCCLS